VKKKEGGRRERKTRVSAHILARRAAVAADGAYSQVRLQMRRQSTLSTRAHEYRASTPASRSGRLPPRRGGRLGAV